MYALCRDERVGMTPSTVDVGNRPGYGEWRMVRAYDHLMTPNSPGCLGGTRPSTDMDFFNVERKGTRPATSGHAGGVHVLICDGAVRFVSDGVDRDAWWALGTRANADNAGDAL